MKSIQIISIVLVFIGFSSCNDSAPSKTETSQGDSLINHADSIFQTTDSKTPTHYEGRIDTTTALIFKEVSVSINRLIVSEDVNSNEIQSDTIEINIELGETIEGQRISITSSQFTRFEVEQRYETSVTINNEGPHCDLMEWKHFYSNWIPLQTNRAGEFICHTYSDKDSEEFPNISIDELKEKVREACGEEWAQHVAKINTLTDYPSSVGISRYFLKITGQHKDTGQLVTKLIILVNPMGC
jgi:hypothetical protein